MAAKRIALLIVFCNVFALSVHAQALHYKRVINDDIVHVLNNIEQSVKFNNSKQDLYINVYIVDDLSGSAGEENCDITNSIYIATSEDGEVPRQYLYKLTSVYDPKIISWTKSANIPSITFSYGEANKRKTATIMIYLDKLIIKQTK